MTQIVTARPLQTKSDHDIVPMRRVAKHSRGDSPATRAGEQTRHRVGFRAGLCDATQQHRTDLRQDRDVPSTLALGVLVLKAPGLGLVCRTSFQIQFSVSMSLIRTPETSPMRVAVQAANMTISPQPAKVLL